MSEYLTDMAFYVSGGIRAETYYKSGQIISKMELIDLYPFFDPHVIVWTSGKWIK